MLERACVHRIGGSPPIQQRPKFSLKGAGFLGEADGRKPVDVVPVLGPTARKVTADVAVAVVAGVGHEDLGTVVKLRDATHRREEIGGQPRFAHVVAELGVHAAHVVVVREDDVVCRMRVEEIVAEHLVQPNPVGVPRLLFRQALHESMVQREVEQAGQAGRVTVRVHLIALPIRQHRRVQTPLLPTDVEIRIRVHHRAAPIAHERCVRIRIGIHPNAAQSQVFNPPQRILDEVIREQRLPLVQIGHFLHKPPVGKSSHIRFRGVGVA